MELYKFDERDPYIQLIFRSVLVTVGSIFPAQLVLTSQFPELGRPLFVPLAMAIVSGTLALLGEVKQKRHISALFGFLLAFALFPGMAYVILKLLQVPFQTRTADFVALIPQAIAGPEFWRIYWKRFHAGNGPVVQPLPDKSG